MDTPNNQNNAGSTPNTPLFVDLDGTLVRSDIMVETVFILLKQNFFYLFLLPLWLLKGKAHFKQQIADRAELDASLLPYNQPFVDYLKEQKKQGRKLILATASNKKYARQIADHLGIFDDVLASDATVNLSGHRKCKKIIETYGEHGFDYAGNTDIDLEIWSHASAAIVVEPTSGVEAKARKICNVTEVFARHGRSLKTYIRALRLHQWLKNVLVFVPLLMAHQFDNIQLIFQASLAFIAFGLCASSAYLLNDLLDLPTDRQHPSKCKRPLAAGTVPIVHGIAMIPLLLVFAFGIALILPVEFLAVLVFYYILTLAYSFRLKKVTLLDVLVLASLYTIRIIAGAAAITNFPSFWLMAFSVFLFLSLALVKRYSELLTLQEAEEEKDSGRGYRIIDLETLAHFGAASGYLAVLVLAFYINSEQIRSLYQTPDAIWLLCMLLLYWISRIWLLTRRGKMHEDPVVFAIRDRRSHWLGIIGIIILWVAI